MMGEKWSFNGWCDWAYKQGNFHERYILNIITAMELAGEQEKADLLRREWEKKVLYFTQEDPWPFGSEMFVDRTAFESSYYIAEYALHNDIEPQEMLWYDKNLHKWYSYKSISEDKNDNLMRCQLLGNLALRGVYEPHYYNRGTAWSGHKVTLEYMTQMGGVALLDYAVRFSNDPAKYINYGYNSLMGSWALISSQKGANDGAAGWGYSPYMDSSTYFQDIKCDKGLWRYCGEIDHGFTGAVYGGATYVVDDPDFGVIAYGGDVEQGKESWRVTPDDGTNRRVFVAAQAGSHLGVELEHDGFADRKVVEFSKGGDSVEFIVENRFGSEHQCGYVLSGLSLGDYQVEVNGVVDSQITIDSPLPSRREIAIKGRYTRVKIYKN